MKKERKELMNFLESLDKRGLLKHSIEEFDYEWVIWDYFRFSKELKKDESQTKSRFQQRLEEKLQERKNQTK